MGANDNSTKRVCRSCGSSKQARDFYSGRASCKACVCAVVRKHRRENDSVREYDRKRGARTTQANLDAYRQQRPDAYRAHNAVSNALRDGKLTREPCLFCGEVRVHGHHRDYSQPLDVIWLCARCHHRLHANFPETAAHEPKHEKAA